MPIPGKKKKEGLKAITQTFSKTFLKKKSKQNPKEAKLEQKSTGP